MLKKQTSRKDWWNMARWVGIGTLACVSVSFAYNVVAFRALGADALHRAMAGSVILPVIMAVPLLSYLTLKMHKLSIANRRLGVVASIDRLTGCLNRGAFTDKVNAYIVQSEFGTVSQCGALLVVDADHFKAINDRFGHEHGDEALTTIARTIRTMLRGNDFVGRLGGEEFGIFLPGVDLSTAALAAERIRRAVNLAVFAPGGELRQLSVSVGGAVFDSPTDFSELFRIADGRLYEAKRFGRNRVEVVPARVASYAHQEVSVA